ncbi:MAG TPA: ABC transporter permease subunit [Bacillota bacterium]|nr:ABC transporter permease subunit [Bacillota bacterium]
MNKGDNRNTLLIRAGWLLTLGLLWEIIAFTGVFNPLLFPRIEVIGIALFKSIQNGAMIQTAGFSLLLIFEGLLIGSLFALGLAALAQFSRVIHGLVETLAVVAHPLPGIALLPLVILWLGTGTRAIVFIIIHSVLWPLLVNTMTGFNTIPRIYREIGANLNLSPWQSFRLILLPASFPYLLSGLKIGWARAWRAIISAEMIFGAAGGIGGLGWYIFQRRVFMDSAGLYAGLIVIIMLGMLVEELVFGKVEELTVKKWGMSV